MKTTFCLRVLVTIVVMTTTACTDPYEGTPDGLPVKGNSQIPTTEFYTMVTAWNRTGDNGYVGLVSTTPYTDLSIVKLYWINDGHKVWIDNFADEPEFPTYQSIYDGYLWADVRNNVLLLHFEGSTAASSPPFPLEVVIVY